MKQKVWTVLIIAALLAILPIDSDGSDIEEEESIPSRSFTDWDLNMNISQIADASFIGEFDGDQLGRSSILGDINGDGYNDTMYSSLENNDTGTRAGKNYIVFGGPDGLSMDQNVSIADITISGEGERDYAYVSGGAGDINNDGFNDIVIAAPHNDRGGVDAGQLYLIFGRPSGWPEILDLSDVNASIYGESEGDYFSFVWGVGYCNGDAIPDLFVSAIGNDDGVINGGKVYIIYGGEDNWEMGMNISDRADASFIGSREGFYLFGAVTVGDLNGDSLKDIYIGEKPYCCETGKVGCYIFFNTGHSLGKDIPVTSADVTIHEEDSRDGFGAMLQTSDYNGDGIADLIFSGPYNDDSGYDAGKSYLFFGREFGWKKNMNATEADVFFYGENEGDQTFNFGGGGDLNGDGIEDIVLSAHMNDDAGIDAGKTYIIFGKSEGWIRDYDLSLADSTILGESSGDRFGYHSSSGGDINKDGYDDLRISSEYCDTGGTDRGKISIIYGKPFLGRKPVISIDESSIRSQLDGNFISGELEITWTADDFEDMNDLNISLYYKEKKTDWILISEDLDNSGSYIWNTNSPRITDGYGYYILVKATDSDGKIGLSQTRLTLGIENPDPPKVGIVYPNKGATLTGNVTLQWGASDDEDPRSSLLIDIMMSENGGNSYFPIAEDLDNNGYYDFRSYEFPDGVSYRLRMEVTDLTGREGFDETENFTIHNDPAVNILLPEEGETISGDYEIWWDAIDPGDEAENLTVNIWISTDGGSNYELLVENIPNTGSYKINSSILPNGDACRLKIIVFDPVGCNCTSVSFLFKIFNQHPPTVEIISPGDGRVFSDVFNIEWIAQDLEDGPMGLFYSIYYKFSEKDIWNQLALNVPNTGNYVVDPNYLIGGDGEYSLMIRVKDSFGLLSEPDYLDFILYQSDPPEIRYPIGPPEPIRDGTAYFEWRASDPDPGEDEDLKVWFYVSHDEEEWLSMAEGIPNANEFNMDVSGLEDGSYQVKMALSDCQEGANNNSVEHVFESEMMVNNINDPPMIEVLNMPSVDVTYSDKVYFTWKGTDDDGDEISYTLYYRMKGDETWTPIEGAIDILETSYSWDVSNLEEEGYYQVKIVGKEDYKDELEMEWISEEFHIKPELDIGNEDREVTINSGLMVGIVLGAVILTIVIVWILFLSVRKKPEEEQVEEVEEEEEELDKIDRLLLEKANETPVPITPEPEGPVIDQIPEDIENDRSDLGTPASEMEGEEPEIPEPDENSDPDGVLGPPLEPSEPSPPGAPAE